MDVRPTAPLGSGLSWTVVTKLLLRIWSFVFRWKTVRLDHEIPTPCVVIAAPHTSNWDFPAMLAGARMNDLDVKWLGKQEMFAGPFGPIFRRLGGVAVDRSSGGDLVGQMVALMRENPDLMVIVPAEATRGKVDYWKSGFYRIARAAQVPIQLSYVDRTTRSSGFGPSILPTGDVGADMDLIRAFYADKEGIKAGRFSAPRLREEDDPVRAISNPPTDLADGVRPGTSAG